MNPVFDLLRLSTVSLDVMAAQRGSRMGIAQRQRVRLVLLLDAAGKVVHNLQDPDGAFAPITSVQEHDGKLYFGSILESAFGRINVPTVKDPA